MKTTSIFLLMSLLFSLVTVSCGPKNAASLTDQEAATDYNLIILLKNGYFDKLIKEELGNYTLTSVKPINKTVPQFLVNLQSSQSDIDAILKKLNDHEGVITAELASETTMDKITGSKSSKKVTVPPVADR